MHFRIVHLTEYRFSVPVFLEPHRLRITPRTDGTQLVRSADLTVSPAPAGQTWYLSEEGNTVRRAWFSGLHDRLELVSSVEVRTLRANPFDFLPDPGGESLPMRLPPRLRAMLAPSLEQTHQASVRTLAQELVHRVGPHTFAFLDALNGQLHEHIRVVERDLGPPESPATTLERGQGACRDMAVLFTAVCRAAGVPARFVSGYQAGDPDQDHRDLHAWAEAFIPGGGWRGYDPTLGLAVADQHVALAASTVPEETLPVAGSYRGDAACTMRVDLHIEAM